MYTKKYEIWELILLSHTCTMMPSGGHKYGTIEEALAALKTLLESSKLNRDAFRIVQIIDLL